MSFARASDRQGEVCPWCHGKSLENYCEFSWLLSHGICSAFQHFSHFLHFFSRTIYNFFSKHKLLSALRRNCFDV